MILQVRIVLSTYVGNRVKIGPEKRTKKKKKKKWTREELVLLVVFVFLSFTSFLPSSSTSSFMYCFLTFFLSFFLCRTLNFSQRFITLETLRWMLASTRRISLAAEILKLAHTYRYVYNIHSDAARGGASWIRYIVSHTSIGDEFLETRRVKANRRPWL